MGASQVRYDEEHSYVYAVIPSNLDKEVPAIGFIAHMDTSDAVSGTNVNPRFIENYDGGPVGIETIAAAVSEERDTIEDVYEPYLMQLGFLGRTPRGLSLIHI